MAWTDEEKAEVIEAYENADPTPETSVEIVKSLAEEFDQSVNGVRIILSKAGVYVKQAAAPSGGNKPASTRVSKQDAQDSLTKALADAGQEVDEDIVSKLTGKAATYFAGVINAVNGNEEA